MLRGITDLRRSCCLEELSPEHALFHVSPQLLTFIFGNHFKARAGEYFLEGCRNKQPASKPTSQRLAEGWTGHVPDALLIPDHGRSTQMGLSVPYVVRSVGIPCSPSVRVNQRAGSTYTLELYKEMASKVVELV